MTDYARKSELFAYSGIYFNWQCFFFRFTTNEGEGRVCGVNDVMS
jgi:hypothetical protein